MGKSKDPKPAKGGKADKPGKGGADKGGDKKSKKGGGGKGGSKADTDSGETRLSKLKGAMTINVRHILCEKYSKSEEAAARLNSGEKFDVVAREMSEDKAKTGGSLGWKTKGSLDPKFEEVAFQLPASPVASPSFGTVKTGFGYHIIMVEDRK